MNIIPVEYKPCGKNFFYLLLLYILLLGRWREIEMTLEDYKKIDADAWVMAQNGIVIPRLRDFGLMVDKKIVTEEEINEEKKCAEYYAVESLCFAVPFWTLSNTFCYCEKSTKRLSKYLIKDESDNCIGINYDNMTRKMRKILKMDIRRRHEAIDRTYNTFNKYVGRDDVLYIYARIGGNNWEYYDGYRFVNRPWFLEKVDWAFDRTYCDIYAKVDYDREMYKKIKAENEARKLAEAEEE